MSNSMLRTTLLAISSALMTIANALSSAASDIPDDTPAPDTQPAPTYEQPITVRKADGSTWEGKAAWAGSGQINLSSPSGSGTSVRVFTYPTGSTQGLLAALEAQTVTADVDPSGGPMYWRDDTGTIVAQTFAPGAWPV
jgi:hypothetical protein